MKIDSQSDFGSRECPSCAMRVMANENRCPICKYEFPNPSTRKRRLRFTVAVIMLALFVLMAIGMAL